jgi:hypothetical protein
LREEADGIEIAEWSNRYYRVFACLVMKPKPVAASLMMFKYISIAFVIILGSLLKIYFSLHLFRDRVGQCNSTPPGIVIVAGKGLRMAI